MLIIDWIAYTISKFYFTNKIIKRKILCFACKPLFSKCGKNLIFDPTTSIFSYSKISIGNDVKIGPNANFISAISNIYIGDKVMFAPNVTIRGGNHNTTIIGKFMRDVKEKQIDNDKDVYIEDDVWIGTNVTILCGVIIGRGAIIAAGSVVNKNVLPYSIFGGVPAKFLKWRFSYKDTILHEEILYDECNRIDKNTLRKQFNHENYHIK